MKHTVWALSLTTLVVLAASSSASACSSCGCTLSSDWENLNYSTASGFKLDLRYDLINQDQLRSGTDRISPSAASQIVNNGDPQEVERYTRNQYVTLSGDYSDRSGWGVNVQLPLIVRKHSTLGTASDGETAGAGGGQYDSDKSNLGDLKVIGRYQGFTPQHNLGLLFGIKLPTGIYHGKGVSTDPTEPDAVVLDRGLQPGTGTTDGIVGAFYSDRLNKYVGYFADALYQVAFDARDHYRPGNGANLNLGVRYLGNPAVIPQLQLNTRYVEHDTGANADTISTGGTLVYLSPGITAHLNKQTSVYAYVQLPIYQRVSGVQLVPTYTLSTGLRYAF
jgi:hypothetical protein